MRTAGQEYQEKQALLHKFVESLQNFMIRKEKDIGRDTAEDVVENIINFVLYDTDRTTIPGATIDRFKQDSIAALTALQEETQHRFLSERSIDKFKNRYVNIFAGACLGQLAMLIMTEIAKATMPGVPPLAFMSAMSASSSAVIAATVMPALIISSDQRRVRGEEITEGITKLINTLSEGLLGAGHMSPADIKKALDDTFYQLDHSYSPRPAKPYQSIEAFKGSLEEEMVGILYLAGKLPDLFTLHNRSHYENASDAMFQELLSADKKAREFVADPKYSPEHIIATLANQTELEGVFSTANIGQLRVALHNLVDICRENIAFVPEGAEPNWGDILAKVDDGINEVAKQTAKKVEAIIQKEAPEVFSVLPTDPSDRWDVLSVINTLPSENVVQLRDITRQLTQPIATELVCCLSENSSKEDLREKVGALSSVDGVALKAFSKSIAGEKPSTQADLIADLIASKNPKAFVDNYLSREKAPKSFVERLGHQNSRSGPQASNAI